MDKDEGWISLHRRIWNWRSSPVTQKRAFTRFEAWIWLLSAASYKDHHHKGQLVKRGQVLTSIKGLSEVWRRNRRTVRGWLKGWKEHGEIEFGGCPSLVVVTICNYKRYQRHYPPDYPPLIIRNKDNNNKKEKKEKKERRQPFSDWYTDHREEAHKIAEALIGMSVTSGAGLDWFTAERRKIEAWQFGDPERYRNNNARFLKGWLSRATAPNPSDAIGRSTIVP